MKFKIGKPSNVIPEGEYLVTIVDIKPQENFNRKTLWFEFSVVEGERRGTVLNGFCNANYESFTSRTKLWAWYCVAMERNDLLEGEEINTDEFFEKVFRAKVENRQSKKTKNMFSNVTALLSVEANL